ncbi:MAG: NAD(P)/FAD-dependent oxidoreductase, partial [Clostridia bacterium]|nr:NAD(P)/FAD-dependent oxidoreductase [Clostridia bacterium]
MELRRKKNLCLQRRITQERNQQMKKTAIIIGAGPAGLTAAYYLLKKTDIKPIILEETEFIGGISRTAEYKGNRIDLGGHRFFSKSDEVNNLWTQILPLQGAPSLDDEILGTEKPLSEDGPDPRNTDKVMLVRDRVSRIFFLRKFFDYPISLKVETFKNMGFARTCKSAFGYMKSCLFKKKEDSLENFYINRFGQPLYEMFFKEYTTKLWGRSPSEISADWGAQRVKGVSVMSVIWNALTKHFRSKETAETSLIEQYYYPKLGPGQLWEAIADEIRSLGGEIILGSRVDKVTVENGNITSVSAGDTAYTADYFFSTMPVKDLVSAMGDAPAEEVRKVADGLPYRDFMTVGLLCDKLKLKNNTNRKTLSNIVPDCWIYVQEPDAVVGRIQVFNNWSPYMVADPANTIWIGLEYFCDEGDKYWSMSDDEFIKFAVDELVRLDIIERDAVKDSLRIKVKKAYPAYFDTYSQFDTVKDYLNGIENLWCLGRNGQHRYNNMDHSMLTAIEAVNAIASGSNSKDAVWNVNTEKDYHESKTAKHKEESSPISGKYYWSRVGAVFLILMAIISVGYFIIFPSRGTYTSDCFDSLLWANASFESGEVFSENYSYAALLPFGAQLWMTPLIAIFGMTMKTQIISMVIFMLIFVASVIFLCRSLKWSTPWCAVALFSVMLMLSSSRYLLEIMWCHVIYYSIGLTLLFLCLGLAARLSRYTRDEIRQSPWKLLLLTLGLSLLSVGAATDGLQVIVLSLIPTAGAVAMSIMLDDTRLLSENNTGAYISIGATVIGAVVGLLVLNSLKGDITAGYAEAFS